MLRDVATYAQGISSEETYYSLSEANCHWFARMVFHAIALRHYSFPLIASQSLPPYYIYRDLERVPMSFSYDDWRLHDPSSSGLVFRFLRAEEWANGQLFWRRTVILAAVLLGLGSVAGVCVGAYFLVIPRIARMLFSHSTETEILIAIFATAIVAAAIVCTTCFKAAPAIARGGGTLLARLVRRRTTRVLSKFGLSFPFPFASCRWHSLNTQTSTQTQNPSAGTTTSPRFRTSTYLTPNRGGPLVNAHGRSAQMCGRCRSCGRM